MKPFSQGVGEFYGSLNPNGSVRFPRDTSDAKSMWFDPSQLSLDPAYLRRIPGVLPVATYENDVVCAGGSCP